MGQPLAVEPEELPRRDAGGDAAKRAGQVPAAFVMSRCRLAGAHARFESHRVGKQKLCASHQLSLRKRKQRGKRRRACMQQRAAHMCVVVIEYVPGLTVGDRRIEKSQFQAAAENRGLRLAARLLQHREKMIEGWMPASRQRAA